MAHDIERAEQRTRQYWYDDGLTEIGTGLLFVALGALFLIEAMAPPRTLPSSFSAFGIVILVAGGLWIINWAVRLAKNRITYPRTGYVRYRRPSRSPQRRILVVVLAILVAALTSRLLTATAPASLDWIPMLQGVCIGAFILYIGYFIGLTRFYLLAALSVISGSAASLAGLGDTLGNGVFFLVMGAALTLSGGIAFRNYLRHTEPPEAE